MNLPVILKKLLKARFLLGILIVGLIFGIVGGVMVVSPKSEKIETTAVVTEIREEYDYSTESYSYYATVRFEDQNGVMHNVDDFSVSSNVKERDEIQICYNVDDPELISTPGSEFLPYIFLIAGIGAFLYGIIMAVKIIKTPADEMNDFNRVKMDSVTSAQIDAVKNNDEPSKEYYFHFTGKLGQSYIFETPARQPIFEAVSLKAAIFAKFQFQFINHLTHREEIKEVTHTVTTSYGGQRTSVITDSHFKINGVNCWKVLGDLGYSVEPHLSGMSYVMEVRKFGIPVAQLEPAGANVATGKDYKLGNIPTHGVFTVSCKESDIEGIFLACFILSRTYH